MLEMNYTFEISAQRSQLSLDNLLEFLLKITGVCDGVDSSAIVIESLDKLVPYKLGYFKKQDLGLLKYVRDRLKIWIQITIFVRSMGG